MKLRELMQWLSKLMPKQKMKDVGDGNIQAGHIGGDLNQNRTSQTIYNIVMLSAEGAANDAEPNAEVDVFSTPKLAPTPARTKTEATQSQRDLLRLMAQSTANEARAEAFMRREFKTDRVKRLSTFECIRTIRYVEACIRREWEQKPSTA